MGKKSIMTRTYIPTGKPRGRPKGTKNKPKVINNTTPTVDTPETILPPIATQAPTQNNQPQANVVNQLPAKPAENRENKDLEEKQEIEKALNERGLNLQKLLDTILPDTDPCARGRMADFLTGTADGMHFKDLSGVTGVTLLQLNALAGGKPLFRSLYYAAKEAGDEWRRLRRVEIAEDHAVNGTERPVFQQGLEVGRIREFDHRLLEFLLKADNPSKYRDQAASVNISNNVVSTVVTFHKECEPDTPKSSNSVAIPSPQDQNEQKP